MDFTPLFRPHFLRLANRTDAWSDRLEDIQKDILKSLISRARECEYLNKFGVSDKNLTYSEFSKNLPTVEYEDLRPYVMRMIKGEKNVLWRGVCRDFAQSSGTSGGKSKYVPITHDSLEGNHYRGAEDSVAHYLRLVPKSRIFSGKGFILGGSFSNTLGIGPGKVHIGDLSATLINRINVLANFVRVPDKKTALLADWEKKLPALVKAAKDEDITNISGVPSWFLTVIRRIMENKGTSTISEVWPNLEVFFHGGISFEPYRDEYKKITDPEKMHFLETYNASEGFFAVQNDFADSSLLLIIDKDIFYEFMPVEGENRTPVPAWEVEEGKVYEMVISSSNGLWRYRLGDTVRIMSAAPLKIKIAGRTKSFINAFGEEVMEDNAEKAIAAACDKCGAFIKNYTAAPQYAHEGKKGRHQWLIEWDKAPISNEEFAVCLDEELRKINSDYDAKRSHSIFLDLPQVITAKEGLFDLWLKSAGSHKLGGQRKVPRLANNRDLMDRLLSLNH